MKKRMTKRIAVIITAVAVAIAGVTCAYAATYLKGDVDGNGDVNLNDAKLALRRIGHRQAGTGRHHARRHRRR